MGADSVTLAAAAGGRAARPPADGPAFGWRHALLLFALFLLVISDYVVDHVVALIPGSTQGREVTNTGAAVQGILLVLAYAAATAVFS